MKSEFQRIRFVLSFAIWMFVSFQAEARNTTPVWKGYTSSAYNGSMSYGKGMNNYCNTAFSGSHACSYRELLKLGNSYPFTQNAWVIDGLETHWEGSNMLVKTKDGMAEDWPASTNPNCSGWSTSSSNARGAIYHTTGQFTIISCAGTSYIPCCQ